jgi:ABC-type nitrate/sulfonate/bicarbonate transport system substrate-binding protein
MKTILKSWAVFFVLALAAQAHSQTKMFVGIPAKTVGFLSLFIAEEKGFFKTEGLEVLNVVMRPESSVGALPSGEVQIGHGQSAVRAAMKGAPVKALMFLYDRPTIVFMARPEIQSFQDLTGKKIATNFPGGDVYFQTLKLMRARGVKDKDYDIVFMGPDPQRLQAMMQGLVHATFLNVDYAAIAEGRFSGVKRMTTVRDLGKDLFSGLGTSDRLLAENPEAVKKFLRATLKGMIVIRDQPEEAARIAQKVIRLDPKNGPSVVRTMRDAIGPTDPGGFPEAVMREWILENAELTGITAEEAKRLKIADVASVKLLREVQEEMGIVCEGGYGCKK